MRFQLRKNSFIGFVLMNVIGNLLVLTLPLAGAETAGYPVARFVVLSDLHFFDSALGTSGTAFRQYLDKDRKLLVESEELLDTALNEIVDLPVEFVLISGDLTKDGERHNHRILARKLERLVHAGKKVYVVPGNHDIRNSHAVRFVGDKQQAIPSISDQEFSTIYRQFGYGDAVESDPHSLSYLAEPVPGLWLLALDSCKWRENQPGEEPLVGGVIYPKTMSWIDGILQRAKKQGKAVIVTLHHGILEHYPFNRDFYPEYLIDNHEAVVTKLANGGVELVFTGHFHAQDITGKTVTPLDKTLYDIETGSLVTAPCPYRVVTLTADQRARISSRFIEAIPSHPTDFKHYATTYVYDGTKKLADEALKKFRVSDHDRNLINPQVAGAFSAHLAGDEQLNQYKLNYDSVGIWGRIIMLMRKKLIKSWYTDLPPADNEVTIVLGKTMSENRNHP